VKVQTLEGIDVVSFPLGYLCQSAKYRPRSGGDSTKESETLFAIVELAVVSNSRG
jgi:hypothetical protein